MRVTASTDLVSGCSAKVRQSAAGGGAGRSRTWAMNYQTLPNSLLPALLISHSHRGNMKYVAVVLAFAPATLHAQEQWREEPDDIDHVHRLRGVVRWRV